MDSKDKRLRSAVIRIASRLPVGDPTRKALLGIIREARKVSMGKWRWDEKPLSPPNSVGDVVYTILLSKDFTDVHGVQRSWGPYLFRIIPDERDGGWRLDVLGMRGRIWEAVTRNVYGTPLDASRELSRLYKSGDLDQKFR